MENVKQFVKQNLVQLFLASLPAAAALWLSHKNINHCPMQLWLHIPCPNCGMYRCFSSLFHGDIWKAMQYNMIPFLTAGSACIGLLFRNFFRKHDVITSVLMYLIFVGCVLGGMLNPFVYQ